MVDRNASCKACDGTGLLADQEFWQYRCTICGGSGVMRSENDEVKDIIDVDETNRILE